MKIEVIGYNPSNGPYSYGSVSVWCANAFAKNGHEVAMFDRSQLDELPKKSDLYFFVDVSEDYSKTMPDDLEGIKVFYAMDTAMPGGLERTVNISRKVDFTFCTNAETYGAKFLKDKYGIDAMWLPYGYDDGLQRDVRGAQLFYGEDKDVFMCGNPNSPERVELWSILNKNFKAITGTINDRETYVQSKARCKIVVNQPTAGYNNIINLRVWNATACNKLLLCKDVSIKEMEVLGFKNGVNVVYWSEFDDLVEKIKYYLDNPAKMDKIRNEGYKLGCKYIMSNQMLIAEQVIKDRFYDKLI